MDEFPEPNSPSSVSEKSEITEFSHNSPQPLSPQSAVQQFHIPKLDNRQLLDYNKYHKRTKDCTKHHSVICSECHSLPYLDNKDTIQVINQTEQFVDLDINILCSDPVDSGPEQTDTEVSDLTLFDREINKLKQELDYLNNPTPHSPRISNPEDDQQKSSAAQRKSSGGYQKSSTEYPTVTKKLSTVLEGSQPLQKSPKDQIGQFPHPTKHPHPCFTKLSNTQTLQRLKSLQKRNQPQSDNPCSNTAVSDSFNIATGHSSVNPCSNPADTEPLAITSLPYQTQPQSGNPCSNTAVSDSFNIATAHSSVNPCSNPADTEPLAITSLPYQTQPQSGNPCSNTAVSDSFNIATGHSSVNPCSNPADTEPLAITSLPYQTQPQSGNPCSNTAVSDYF